MAAKPERLLTGLTPEMVQPSRFEKETERFCGPARVCKIADLHQSAACLDFKAGRRVLSLSFTLWEGPLCPGPSRLLVRGTPPDGERPRKRQFPGPFRFTRAAGPMPGDSTQGRQRAYLS